jgi:hypothetical protein
MGQEAVLKNVTSYKIHPTSCQMLEALLLHTQIPIPCHLQKLSEGCFDLQLKVHVLQIEFSRVALAVQLIDKRMN